MQGGPVDGYPVRRPPQGVEDVDPAGEGGDPGGDPARGLLRWQDAAGQVQERELGVHLDDPTGGACPDRRCDLEDRRAQPPGLGRAAGLARSAEQPVGLREAGCLQREARRHQEDP